MKTVIWITLIVIVLGLAGGAWYWMNFGSIVSQKPGPLPPVDLTSVRQLEQGKVVGFKDGIGVQHWLGIPYAAPPVGKLRWRAPQPAQPWQGERKALAYGAICPQYSIPMFTSPAAKPPQVRGDEDCLTLNVFAPAMSPESVPQGPDRMPVMVWIHGGGNSGGEARIYDGIRHLATRDKVVLVTIQYRLGIFGWFAHPAILADGTTAEDRSGNFGTLDQIAALRWVRDNIAAFGGDPQRVTVFGESAGGMNVLALLASPPARGLFQRAIVQSGIAATNSMAEGINYTDDAEPGMSFSAKEVAANLRVAEGQAADRAAAKAQLAGMKEDALRAWLRGMSAEELLKGVKPSNMGMYPGPRIFRDGVVIPADGLMAAYADPARVDHVPVIMGTNRDEYKTFIASNPEYVSRHFLFLRRVKDQVAYDRVAKYFSDRWKVRGADDPARAMTQAGLQSVWVYRWDWNEGRQNALIDTRSLYGAAHGMEISFAFGAPEENDFTFSGNAENRAGRKTLSDAMVAYWLEFAKSGDPGRGTTGSFPDWKAWSTGGGEHYLHLDAPSGGGVRMGDDVLDEAHIKARLIADKSLDEKGRCRMYAELYLYGVMGSDLFRASEYDALGCKAYPVESFKPTTWP
ncbi:MAG: carboxylesterase family protein [Proteobacteria bacterium]|nr:carboxylesterase family protein [Pseudomonadota bacterium]HQR02646.1 carboxylesterase family protein [Rhodocyclaceae bacterium]